MSDVIEPTVGVVERLKPDPRSQPAQPGPSGQPAAEPSPPPADTSVMSLVDHLAELRHRLAICIVVVLIGGVIGFYFAPSIITALAAPLPDTGGTKVQFLTVSGGFLLFMKVSIVVGIILGLPVILYELWAFVAPGLTPEERKTALPWIPMTIIFFVMGVAVAYVTLPYAVAFLTGFNIVGVAETKPSAESYFGFVMMIFLIFGAVMEFPIVLVLLHRLGVLSVDKLRTSRRYVLLGIVIFAVVITPGGDPISPMVMSITMYALFEFTIFLLIRSDRRKAEKLAKTAGA